MGYHVIIVGELHRPGMKNHLTHIGYAMSKQNYISVLTQE